MKTNLTLLSLLISIFAYSQSIVITTPQEKNVVLEEFTGIHCGYCPQGHAIGEQLVTDHPNRVVLVNIHTGSYATPGTGEPDFRTAYGSALATNQGVTGFPSGSINRHLFPGESAVATSRGSWTNNANSIFSEQSPVNIGFTTAFDSASRILTINVEAYYTLNSEASENYIQVAFLQNHVIGYQSDYANGTTNSYDHKHILRELITGQWGDTIHSTTQGSLFTKQYTYTVPNNFNGDTVIIDNCDIAIYITENKQETYTAMMGNAKSDTIDGTTNLYIGDLTMADEILEGTPNQETTFTTNASSSLSGNEDFKFILTSDAPNNWQQSFTINSTNYTDTAIVTIQGDTPINFDIKVTPSDSSFLAKYTLTMQSINNPTANAKIAEFYVISGITDLIVNGTGSFGDGNSYYWGNLFTSAFSAFGAENYGITSSDIMVKGFNAGAMSGVENIYANIGWTFPALKDDEANALMNFMDNGGNLFISGQDIGWDIKSGSGSGNAITQNLYTNYLHASYLNDGSTANSILNTNSDDHIFNDSLTSPIIDVYAGNFFPDEISPINGAIKVFEYNTASKTSGIRYFQGNYKTLYLGYGIEMLADSATRTQILKTTYDWFHNIILDGYISETIDNQCNGVCEGTATVSPSGGNPPYTYIWDNTSQTDSTAENLCAGNYTVYIIDNMQDSISFDITINEPNYITTSTSVSYTSCDTCNDGTATVNAQNGSGQYTYLWNDPLNQTTNSIDSLSTGAYIVTITDTVCSHQIIDTIFVRVVLSAIISDKNNALCNGSCDGTLTILPNGGLAPYQYEWNIGTQTDSTAENLCADNYSITVTDSENNTTIILDTITQPESIYIESDTVIDASTASSYDGSISVTVNGGSEQFEYLWNDSLAQTTSTAVNLKKGTYTVTTTDIICGEVITKTYDLGSTIGIKELSTISKLTSYPNPVKNIINFNKNINSNYKITNTVGKIIKQGYVNNSINISELNTGLYIISFDIYSNKIKFNKK